MLKSEFEAAKLQNNYMPNYYLKITSAANVQACWFTYCFPVC